MAKKGKQVAMLDDPQQLYVFTFIVNKTEHINVLNVRLQGYQSAYRMTQQLQCGLDQTISGHFPLLKSLVTSVHCLSFIVMSISWTSETDAAPLLAGFEFRVCY